MRVILGIGNPGQKYELNRHNVGFLFVDKLALKHSLQYKAGKGDYYFASGSLSGSNFFIIKPTTYVNNSGFAAKDILSENNISPEDLLVIYDDLNIENGKYRLRAGGSAGGHNGISSIIYHLNSDNFPRIKIGIGQQFEKGKMADYVLSDFNRNELNELDKLFDDVLFLSEEFIKGGKKHLLDANSKLQKSKENLEN